VEVGAVGLLQKGVRMDRIDYAGETINSGWAKRRYRVLNERERGSLSGAFEGSHKATWLARVFRGLGIQGHAFEGVQLVEIQQGRSWNMQQNNIISYKKAIWNFPQPFESFSVQSVHIILCTLATGADKPSTNVITYSMKKSLRL
jgi:hypothetical protein